MAKRSPSRARGGSRPASSLALIEIDQRPFLKQAATTCRRLRTELANKQEQLREFEEEAVAEFDQWLHRTHGAELTRLRELRRELEEWEFICAQVRALEWTHPKAVGEELEDLLKRRENGTLPDYVPLHYRRGADGENLDDDDEEDEDEDEDEDDMDDMDDFEDFDEAFEAEFEKFFERMGGGFGDFDDGDSGGREPGGDGVVVRLKATYRLLAKRLHPDLSDLPADQREKRWHELQAAYQQSDLEGMQRIEAVCDMDRTGITTKLGLARLRDLIAYHQSHLGPLRQALREAKRHPAFPHPKQKREQIRREVGEEIRESVEQLEEEVTGLREFVEEAAAFDEDQEPDWIAVVSSDDSSDGSSDEATPPPRSGARKTPKRRPADDPRQMDLFDF